MEILVPTIKDIVNNSLRNRTFDGSWKESITLLLHKEIGQDRPMSNYRPYVSKQTKNAMLDQLDKHTDNNNQVPSTRCAYRKKKLLH